MIDNGIHTLDAGDYHADPSDTPSLSASIAHLLVNQTPRHAWNAHPRLNPNFEREEKAIYDSGTVAHSLILEGDASKVCIVEADDWRTKAAQQERNEARENGQVALLAKDWKRVRQMADAIRDQLARRNEEPALFTDGKAEQSMVWQEGGVTCRARVDWLRDDHVTIDDLKTTGRSANPLQWSKNTLWSIGADIQVAFNLRGLKAITGEKATFRYVLIENQPPYAISVVSLAASALELGQQKADRAIQLWKQCLDSGDWPAYPPSTYFAETPAFEEARWMEHDGERLAA